MDREDLQVSRIETQHEVSNIYGRGVRFDVFVTDSLGRDYNFEIQNADSDAIPKRARYNSSMLDYHSLKAGKDWDKLPETYVIFITKRDVLKHALPIYHIDRNIKELDQDFPDEAHILYVNGENTSDTPLGRLMQDFRQTQADKISSNVLAQRMKLIKNNESEVSKMCEAVEQYAAEREARGEARGIALGEARGEANGILRGKAESIKNLMCNTQYTAEQAMEALGIPKAEFSKYLAML